VRLLLDGTGHPVRGENHGGTVGNLGQLVDEHRAQCAQALDDVAVVHDLVAHVDRRTVLHQRAFDDLDRAHHAGAKSAGLGQDYLHRHPSFRPNVRSRVGRNSTRLRTLCKPR
jgi:hypothetical protein